MNIHPVAPSYWRSVKAGTRTFGQVRTEVQESVRELARREVEAGAIAAADYKQFIGEALDEVKV